MSQYIPEIICFDDNSVTLTWPDGRPIQIVQYKDASFACLFVVHGPPTGTATIANVQMVGCTCGAEKVGTTHSDWCDLK